MFRATRARRADARAIESHREVLIEIKRGAINIRVSLQQIKRQPFSSRHLDQPWTEISIESSEISRRPFLGSSDPRSTKAHRDCFSRDNVVGERRAFRERESRARPIIAKLMKLFQESREREPAGASTATLPISFLFLHHPSRDASVPCVASGFFSSLPLSPSLFRLVKYGVSFEL